MPSTGARRAGLRPAQASAMPSTTSAQHWPNIMHARTAMRPVDGRRVRALGMDSSPEVDRSLARGATHFVTGHNDVLEPFPSRSLPSPIRNRRPDEHDPFDLWKREISRSRYVPISSVSPCETHDRHRVFPLSLVLSPFFLPPSSSVTLTLSSLLIAFPQLLTHRSPF